MESFEDWYKKPGGKAKSDPANASDLEEPRLGELKARYLAELEAKKPQQQGTSYAHINLVSSPSLRTS